MTELESNTKTHGMIIIKEETTSRMIKNPTLNKLCGLVARMKALSYKKILY